MCRYEIAVLVMVIVLSIIEVYSVLRLGHTYLYNGWHVIAIFNYALYYIGFAFRGQYLSVRLMLIVSCPAATHKCVHSEGRPCLASRLRFPLPFGFARGLVEIELHGQHPHANTVLTLALTGSNPLCGGATLGVPPSCGRVSQF